MKKLKLKNILKVVTKHKFNRGQTIIELILAMGLATFIFPTLLAGFMSSREGRPQQEKRLQAVTLLKETENAVRAARDNSWDNFAVDGTYHTAISNNKWILVAGTPTPSELNQEIVISSINRDTNGAIVPSGGNPDPSTKKVKITISWTQPTNSSITSTIYLTRTGNITHLDTTYEDLNAGSKSNVVTTYTSGSPTDGQIQLGAGGGGGDWCSPSFSITAVDLPKSGVANAVTAIAGPDSNESTVFAGTGENASGVSFAKIDLPGNPPVVPTPYPTYDGYKTNAVFGDSSYAYLTTDNNSKEVDIIDLHNVVNNKYQEAGSINLPGNVNGSSVFASNGKLYVTSSDNKFYIYDISSTRSPTNPLNTGGLTLDGVGKKVLVAGNYAYIATSSTTYPLEAVNISNPSNVIDSNSANILGKLTLGTGQSGVDVYVNTANQSPTRAYLATTQLDDNSEFYIIRINNLTLSRIDENGNTLGSYETEGMTPTGVTVVTGNRAIIVGTGGTYQYQVIGLVPETGELNECGANAHLSYPTGIRGIASALQSAGYAYSYVITGDASSELKIILGGAGGIFTSSGEFESFPYDPGYSTAYNRFLAHVYNPTDTTIEMQVAVASPGANGCSDASYEYVGPNGSLTERFQVSETKDTISGIIPFGNFLTNYQNPERCFRYKTWFSSNDITYTPILYDLTVNYSP